MYLDREETIERITTLKQEIEKLPAVYIVYKNIKGKKQPYLQWNEDGKTKSKYIKASEREEVFAKVSKRKELNEELKTLIACLNDSHAQEDAFDDEGFQTNLCTGFALFTMTKNITGLKKRDCYSILSNYLDSNVYGKVCLLFGLRRTGKTTLLFQAVQSLNEFGKTAYIKARSTDTMSNLNHDLKLLFGKGYRYIFIDEITLMKDFISSASLLSDVFGMQDMKIVLSGTDSLGFWFAEDDELYDRAISIHTTFIPYREYEALLGIQSIDEYIRYGGTLRIGEIGNSDDDASFKDDESTRRYIDSAICKNIQHSLICYENKDHYSKLKQLYENNELTGAINRIIESMTHQFVLKVLTDDFVSHDLGSAVWVLRKDPIESHRSDAPGYIDKEPITKKLMYLLEIKNKENQKEKLSIDHVKEIEEYLKALDLVIETRRICIDDNCNNIDYALFTQPGMRYCQANALVNALLEDDAFNMLLESEKQLICNRILEEVRGRMMEDIVLLETMKKLPKNFKVFKLSFLRGEYDMLIYDQAKGDCQIYEIKHSDQINEKQYIRLIDKECNLSIEKRYGPITRRAVIYRGKSTVIDVGEEHILVDYINVEEYLRF